MLSDERRLRPYQREHVLQLIAEPKRAARLIKAAARPVTAAQILVEQPLIHQHVEGIVRGADLDRLERRRPGGIHLLARSDRGFDRRISRDEGARVFEIGALAEDEDQPRGATRRQHALDLHRGAWVEPSPGTIVERWLRE